MAEPASERARLRRKQATGAGHKIVPEAAASGSVLEAALAPPTQPKYVRMQILISPEQEERLNRLAYEKKLKKVEIVRRMIDALPDDQV
jgi:hypothetical protein